METTEIQTIEETQVTQYNFESMLNPGQPIKLANTIKEYAEKQGLVSTIKKKKYANVEAWQYAGSLLGLFPRVKVVKDLSTEKLYKYWAEVEIVKAQTGEVVANGTAICTNAESTKRTFDEYAICSMAQTRATGKAFRLLIGWMFKMADLEATPAEEMEDMDPNKPVNGPTVSVLKKEYRAFVMEAIKCCCNATDVRDLAKLAPTFMKHQPDAEVIDVCKGQFEILSKVGGDDNE